VCRLRATEEVLVELKKKADEVHKWAKLQRELFVLIGSHTRDALS
jgi:hypothetical protein